MPLALPPLVAGVGLLILFGSTSFGKWLADIGIQFVFTPYGIVIAQFFVNMPFMFRVLRSTFQGINPRYEYVAQTLVHPTLKLSESNPADVTKRPGGRSHYNLGLAG
jgi:molybdate transport system permease protein